MAFNLIFVNLTTKSRLSSSPSHVQPCRMSPTIRDVHWLHLVGVLKDLTTNWWAFGWRGKGGKEKKENLETIFKLSLVIQITLITFFYYLYQYLRRGKARATVSSRTHGWSLCTSLWIIHQLENKAKLPTQKHNSSSNNKNVLWWV